MPGPRAPSHPFDPRVDPDDPLPVPGLVERALDPHAGINAHLVQLEKRVTKLEDEVDKTGQHDLEASRARVKELESNELKRNEIAAARADEDKKVSNARKWELFKAVALLAIGAVGSHVYNWASARYVVAPIVAPAPVAPSTTAK